MRFIFTDAQWINIGNVFRVFMRPDGRYTVAYSVAGEVSYTTADDDAIDNLSSVAIPAQPGYYVIEIDRHDPPHSLYAPIPVVAWQLANACMRPLCMELLSSAYAVQCPDGRVIDEMGSQFDSPEAYRAEEVAHMARAAANNARREAIEAENAKNAAGAGEK